MTDQLHFTSNVNIHNYLEVVHLGFFNVATVFQKDLLCFSLYILGGNLSILLLLLLLLLRRFSCVRLCATPQMAAHQAPPSLDSPGKNTGVGCHFLLQCMKVKYKSEVTQSCPTLSDPMDRSLPGSSAHGTFQARALEWGAIAFSILYHYHSFIQRSNPVPSIGKRNCL